MPFILSFDDIDVDVEQGWNVLESLRRYLSDTHIISIVTGNIKLYGIMVRYELSRNLKMPEGNAREMMTNELESQYMLKLLNPSNRINLHTLSFLMENNHYEVKVINEGDETELMELYRGILSKLGIIDYSSQKIFIGFLLLMSLRSQIHFMRDTCATKKAEGLPLDVFTSRLYAACIDIETLRNNAQITNIAILNYLNAKASLPDCYLLLPTLPDKDINSVFMALTLLECWHFKRTPSALFDYMLRIGYLRNLILPLEKKELIENLCKYAGWNQVMSLKNNVGLTMGYVAGKKLGSLQEHIPLFALGEKGKKAKEAQVNALDKVLKAEGNNSFGVLMAMFPFIRITHNKDNESRSYYSVVVLLAVVAEVLKCESKNEMEGRINDLKLFRSYKMPQDENYQGEEQGIETNTFGIEPAPDLVAALADMMLKWKNAYKECTLPPYTIGRIITKLYTSLENVTSDTVGKMMNVMVANLFNSCLVEETRVKVAPSEQGCINNSNLRTDTRYFIDNLGKRNVVEKLKFTRWVMSCPMLNCFLDSATYDKVHEYVVDDLKEEGNNYSVYGLLCKIQSKEREEGQKPPFSGEKAKGWKQTVEIMQAHHFSREVIEEKIVNEQNMEKVIEYINSTNLFSKVLPRSVEQFKENYKREDAAEEAQPVHIEQAE